ncbi:uncharacterized protein LACBIDRAFT_318915 [Laccaria bicolor S238N-H82]|uniref:Predicted protein n=1 Tax=Laccaria bicolor (strain S238N-H82 / ATCC MYA-4686) TaxID=486041 RepID=B0D7F1_LACBS|nr:uncharacterized protein LACBIDRAFT_318915 [Laccaria bicolor S238N-H82]EDR09384.1 predicted protein [Laccaria bicolor S238N-H82]|eukprot:XP_001879733.1 predicted protein [Laccaria bicolor S238N-H82]
MDVSLLPLFSSSAGDDPTTYHTLPHSESFLWNTLSISALYSRLPNLLHSNLVSLGILFHSVMKSTRWADTNSLVHTKVSGVQWRRAESLLIYIENLIPFFFRHLSMPQSNANHFLLSYLPLLLCIINHGLFNAISIFMFAPACENSRRPQRLSVLHDRCSPMSRNQSAVLWFGRLKSYPVGRVKNVLWLTRV